MEDEAFPYATADAFDTAIKDRLAAIAKSNRHDIQELRRYFAYDRLLARVFANSPTTWVLKGGTSLLARIPDQARYSVDIDLFFKGELEAAIDELRDIAADQDFGDYFTFEIAEKDVEDPPRRDLNQSKASLKVTAYIGDTEFQRFALDLVIASNTSNMTQEPETVPSLAMLSISGLPKADYRVYPLVDHIADKHAAMISTYQGGKPSSRYRDLVDLAIIASYFPIDAGELHKALFSEYAFRGLKPPRSVELPDQSWVNEYPIEASKAPALAQQSATEGLSVAKALLEPILNGRKTGTWNYKLLRWDDAV